MPSSSAHPPPDSAFQSPRADPIRKAKLIELAPKLDAFYETLVAKYGVTGAAVAVVLEGEVAYWDTFGVRDLGSKLPVDERTVFRVGSVSKTITALAVMRLRDQGKLELDVPAATYLPLIESLKLPTRDSPAITLRHLLSMSSGLPYDDVWGAVSFGFDDAELEAYLERGVQMAGAPGDAYRYSNLGFALLGKVVERVSGLPFERFVEQELFAPLAMLSSGYVTSRRSGEHWATGYFKDGERWLPEAVPADGVFAPAGGAFTTIADLARYAAFQLAAYPPRDDPESGPVARSTLREMHNGSAWARWHENYPVVQVGPDGEPSLTAASYGFGWMENTTCRVSRMVQHRGYEPGYFASIRLLPDERLGLVVLSTSANLERLADFERLLDLFEEAGLLTAPSAPVPAELRQLRDAVVRMLAASEPGLVEQNFDPDTQRYSFMKPWREEIQRLAKQHGKCRPEGEIQAVSPRHARFRLVCDSGALGVTAYVTPGEPALLQMLEWRQELPLGDAERSVQQQLRQALARDQLSLTKLLAATAPRDALLARLRVLRAAHPDCQFGSEGYNDGRGNTVLALSCARVQRELSLRLDEVDGRVRDWVVRAPRAYGSTCAH